MGCSKTSGSDEYRLVVPGYVARTQFEHSGSVFVSTSCVSMNRSAVLSRVVSKLFVRSEQIPQRT